MKTSKVPATCFWGIVLLTAALCVSFPAFSTGHVIAGADMAFHLARIEGIAEGLQGGAFPVRLNPVQAGGYGMPTGIFYPDLFLYIPALLRLAGVPLLICWKITFLGIHLLTAFLSWWAFSVVTRSRHTGAIAALFYEIAFFRLVMGYITMDIGASLAMLFLPAALVSIWMVLRRDPSYWPMAVLCSVGVLLSHVLTSVFLVMATLLMIMISLPHFTHPEVRAATWRAVTFIFLLTIWFYAPFLYLHHHMKCMIELSTQSVWPIMTFTAHSCEFFIGIGMLIFIFCLAVRQLFYQHKVSKTFFILVFFSFSIIFLSSSLSLWQELGPFGGWIQFPWRLTVFSAIMLSIASAIGLRRSGIPIRSQRLTAILAAILIFSENVLWLAGMSYRLPPWVHFFPTLFETRMTVSNYWSRFDIQTSDGSMDYMDLTTYERLMASWPELPSARDKLQRKSQSREIIPTDRITDAKRTGTTFFLHDTGGAEEWVRLPIYWYPGYVAESMDGKHILCRKDDDGQVEIHLPSSGDSSSVRVGYDGLPWFHATDLLSWFSLFGFSLIVIRRQRLCAKKRKQN